MIGECLSEFRDTGWHVEGPYPVTLQKGETYVMRMVSDDDPTLRGDFLVTATGPFDPVNEHTPVVVEALLDGHSALLKAFYEEGDDEA